MSSTDNSYELVLSTCLSFVIIRSRRVARLVSVLPSVLEVPSSILSDSNVPIFL